MRPEATGVWGFNLPVYEALSYVYETLIYYSELCTLVVEDEIKGALAVEIGRLWSYLLMLKVLVYAALSY